MFFSLFKKRKRKIPVFKMDSIMDTVEGCIATSIISDVSFRKVSQAFHNLDETDKDYFYQFPKKNEQKERFQKLETWLFPALPDGERQVVKMAILHKYQEISQRKEEQP